MAAATILIILVAPQFHHPHRSAAGGLDCGFRAERGTSGGWIGQALTTAHGEIRIAASSDKGPWFQALQIMVIPLKAEVWRAKRRAWESGQIALKVAASCLRSLACAE